VTAAASANGAQLLECRGLKVHFEGVDATRGDAESTYGVVLDEDISPDLGRTEAYPRRKPEFNAAPSA
jgi:hypothetical protein